MATTVKKTKFTSKIIESITINEQPQQVITTLDIINVTDYSHRIMSVSTGTSSIVTFGAHHPGNRTEMGHPHRHHTSTVCITANTSTAVARTARINSGGASPTHYTHWSPPACTTSTAFCKNPTGLGMTPSEENIESAKKPANLIPFAFISSICC